MSASVGTAAVLGMLCERDLSKERCLYNQAESDETNLSR